MDTTPQTVRETLAQLRALPPLPAARRQSALARFWKPWLSWLFPANPQRFLARGLHALAASAPHCSEPGDASHGKVLALILAGNTPLLAWPVLHYAVLLGIPVFIKQSRDETVWARTFVERLAEIDPAVAALLHLDLFPGEDPRTQALVQSADAVIAYGGEATIAALRSWTPESTPFLGFGHALSVGIWAPDGALFDASLFADDWIAYDQSGCLSLQALFFQNASSLWLPRVLYEGTEDIELLPPRADPAECRIVREARELALMEGGTVYGDEGLCWTLIVHPEPCALPAPTGLRVLHVIPLDDLTQFGRFLGPAKGRLSSVGVAGALSEGLRTAIEAEGVSRICPAGQMQTPPLDWPNGGVDLRQWLLERF